MSLKLCVHRLATVMFVIMQQIHLSTLEKILYFNMQLSGQDYNVQEQTKHWLHESTPYNL